MQLTEICQWFNMKSGIVRGRHSRKTQIYLAQIVKIEHTEYLFTKLRICNLPIMPVCMDTVLDRKSIMNAHTKRCKNGMQDYM